MFLAKTSENTEMFSMSMSDYTLFLEVFMATNIPSYSTILLFFKKKL